MKNIVFLFVFFFGFVINAQKKFSLNDCIDYAVKHNTKVLSYKTNKEINSLLIKSYKNERLPKINFNANEGFQLGNTYNVSTGVGQKQSSYTSFNLNTQVELFSGFKQKYKIQHQKILDEISTNQLDNVIWNLKFDIINTYFKILFEKENLAIIENTIKNQEQQIKIISKLNKQLLKPTEDLISSKIELKKLLLQKTKIENSIDNYKNKLYELLNTKDIEIQYDNNSQKKEILFKKNIDWDKFPSVLSLKNKIELNEKEIKMEKSKRYPSLSFNYSIGSSYYHIIGREDLIYNLQSGTFEPYGFKQQFQNNLLHYLYFNLRIPIFNGFSIKNNIKELELKKQMNAYNYETEKQKMKTLYQELLNDINLAKNNYDTQKEIFQLAEKNYIIKQKKYLKNIITYNDWQIAKNKFFESKTKLLLAKYEMLLKQEIYIRLYKYVIIY